MSGAGGKKGGGKGGKKTVVAVGSGRRKTVIVKGGGRRSSSTRWLQRQLNDPYVHAAQDAGYRSRSTFKLIELDERFHFLGPGKRVLDLGAAPGGWSQVAAEGCSPGGAVVAVDIQEITPMAGVIILQMDAFAEDAIDRIGDALAGPADIVMSDMAAPATGHAATDHLRVVALCEAALDIAGHILVPGGTFIAKVFKGGTERDLLANLKRDFARVRHAKPPASRSGSAEEYVIATGFRGGNN